MVPHSLNKPDGSFSQSHWWCQMPSQPLMSEAAYVPLKPSRADQSSLDPSSAGPTHLTLVPKVSKAK